MEEKSGRKVGFKLTQKFYKHKISNEKFKDISTEDLQKRKKPLAALTYMLAGVLFQDFLFLSELIRQSSGLFM